MNGHLNPLGALINIKHGFAFKGEYFSNDGKYILLSPGNCHERGGLKLKGEKEKFYIGDIPDAYILKSGDLLVVMTDLVNTAPILGGAFFIPEDDKYLHNQRLGLVEIKDPKMFDSRFAFYAFNYDRYRSQVRGSASGATVRHTAPERIYKCMIPLPDILSQKAIADILSAYDSLITNNDRRIALLERSAWMLFEEWFVRLRYPGHEHDTIINGAPERWERKLLGEVSPLVYGKALKSENRIPGNVAVYGSSGEVGSHDKPLVSAPGIVVGRKGNVGSVFWVAKDFWPIDTAYYVDPRNVSLFVYHLLLNQTFENSDAAVPGLNRDYAHKKEIKWPSKELRLAYELHVEPLFKQRQILMASTQKLEVARDLLLPRLMDGRIAV